MLYCVFFSHSKENNDTIIYRYYATPDSNLAPRSGTDYDGLSFMTVPPKKHQLPAVMTTLSAVKETGLFKIRSNTLSTIVVEWEGVD